MLTKEADVMEDLIVGINQMKEIAVSWKNPSQSQFAAHFSLCGFQVLGKESVLNVCCQLVLLMKMFSIDVNIFIAWNVPYAYLFTFTSDQKVNCF